LIKRGDEGGKNRSKKTREELTTKSVVNRRRKRQMREKFGREFNTTEDTEQKRKGGVKLSLQLLQKRVDRKKSAGNGTTGFQTHGNAKKGKQRKKRDGTETKNSKSPFLLLDHRGGEGGSPKPRQQIILPKRRHPIKKKKAGDQGALKKKRIKDQGKNRQRRVGGGRHSSAA